jgi:AcrR family transcriptional regulator
VDVILNAARRIFLDHGYGDATTDMIQEAAGVSKSTLYAHFPTKRALFEAVCDMKSENFEKALRDAVGSERRPRQYLNRFGNAFIGYLLSTEGLAFYRLLVAGARRFPELGQTMYFHTGIKASSDMIEAYLKEASGQGWLKVPDPVISAEHFLGMLRGELYTRAVLNAGRVPNATRQRNHVTMTVNHFLAAHETA